MTTVFMQPLKRNGRKYVFKRIIYIYKNRLKINEIIELEFKYK